MAVASLGMYDDAAVRDANDLLWRLVADRLRASGVADVPVALHRQRPLGAIWSDPDLLLTQYPLLTRHRDRLRYVATPCYTAPGCVFSGVIDTGAYRESLRAVAECRADVTTVTP